MPIPIPYALDYTATVSGQIPKFVTCEKCTMEYVYLMQRSAQGEGTSFLFLNNAGAQDRAQAEAEAALFRKLQKSCDLVPCPSCGWYQNDMVLRSRKLLHRWITPVLWFITPGAIVVLLLALVSTAAIIKNPKNVPLQMVIWSWPGALLLTFAVIASLRWRRKRRACYDINQEEIESRKQLGQKLAMSKQRFLQVMQSNFQAGGQEEIQR